MALKTGVTATTKTEVNLHPATKKKLLTKLTSYAELAAQRKAIKLAMKQIEAEVGHIRETTGEQSIAIEGFKITNVKGTQSKIDKKKLVELGCAMAWIEEATVVTPKKAYEKITCPGQGDEEED